MNPLWNPSKKKNKKESVCLQRWVLNHRYTALPQRHRPLRHRRHLRRNSCKLTLLKEANFFFFEISNPFCWIFFDQLCSFLENRFYFISREKRMFKRSAVSQASERPIPADPNSWIQFSCQIQKPFKSHYPSLQFNNWWADGPGTWFYGPFMCFCIFALCH